MRVVVALALALALGMGACGDDGVDSDVERGAVLARDVGCTACHAESDEDGIGPGWEGIWGTEVALADGGSVIVDEQYLRRSIVEPDAQVVEGFAPAMPRVPLSDDEIDALVAYLREVTGG